MSYQHPISGTLWAAPARRVVIAIDGGDHMPRPGLSPRRRAAIIAGASALLWLGIILLAWTVIR